MNVTDFYKDVDYLLHNGVQSPPMIVTVFDDGTKTDVPVTPETTISDVIECCRDPGDEPCDLICPEYGENPLRETDLPLDILQRWGSGRLILRYTTLKSNGEIYEKRDGMKEPDHFIETLPDGVQLTLSELREMACRQQSQIDSQHQLLAAKEQRLRYLKDQEARQQRLQAESDRLRRLRDRVDAQELKLRKLRALRGQVDHQKQNNISLTSDLDSIRALFNEKEKELSLAVAKVEELTRQLEELRRGRTNREPPPPSALELDKLRRELMYRNKLNEQQNQRLNQQREALTARQEEMSSIDKRISELQERLHRKRMLNQQLASQISAASEKAAYNQLVSRLSNTAEQNDQEFARKQQQNRNNTNGLSRGNIAAVEPYNHLPLQSTNHIINNRGGLIHNSDENSTYQQNSTNNINNILYQHNQHIKQQQLDTQPYDPNQSPNEVTKHYHNNSIKTQQDDTDVLKDFTVSKSDPKYQTLPYNTKFTVNLLTTNTTQQQHQHNKMGKNVDHKTEDNNMVMMNGVATHMPVHSAPLNAINKNVATPLNQHDIPLVNRKALYNGGDQQHEVLSRQPSDQQQHHHEALSRKPSDHQYQHELLSRKGSDQHFPNVQRQHQVNYGSEQDGSKTQPITYQKPISSVAPTSINHSGILSNIYQTSSMKVQMVEPQTVNTKLPQPMPPSLQSSTVVQSPPQTLLSPPQSSSTPLSTPEVSLDKSPKPALPPKPSTIKPPPRQMSTTQPNTISEEQIKPPPLPLTEPPAEENNNNNNSNKSPLQNNCSNSNPKTAPIPLQKPYVKPSYQSTNNQEMIIKAKPLTIKKQLLSEQPKLRSTSSNVLTKLTNNRSNIQQPIFQYPIESTTNSSESTKDETDSRTSNEEEVTVVRRCKKGNLKQNGKTNLSRRVSFDPLALLLDASLEGELELVKKTATQVANPSAANDEGITALHNAICAGHLEIVKFLVEFGCDVNAQDSDGWTPLHCAASCNNLTMVKFLVEHGACIFATTLSDHETAAEKCEEDEEGFDGCSEYLYSVQEKLGILNGGLVYAVFDYNAQQPDELSFKAGQQFTILRKGDENEREWWWARLGDKEGYVPRNLLGLYPRVQRNDEIKM